jgi:predicted HTH transcriptional regulator
MKNKHTDRYFMELAMREMFETPEDHIEKSDPLVGAVLIDRNGEFLAKAHRGTFGTGDHSEFSVFEKRSPNKDFRGGTIYVTLEPCTSRNLPKKPCALRVAESGVIRAVIGIEDPNPKIKKRGIKYLRKHGVQVDFFDYDLADEIRLFNKDFINSMSNKSKASKNMSRIPKIDPATRDESQPIWQSTTKDLSRVAIKKYLSYNGLPYRIPSAQLWQEFHKCGFLEKRKNTYVPTIAGLVLFGSQPDKFPELNEHSISAEHFVGTPEDGISLEKIADRGRIHLSLPLWDMVKRTELFFVKSVSKVPRLKGIERIERGSEYPIKVIRETIVNALVHRDYSRPAHISFRIFRDRTVISSPGILTAPNTLDRIRKFDVTPVRRNRIIAKAAQSLKLMEREGYGIPNMPNHLKEFGLRPPQFEQKHGHFIVTLLGREKSSPTLRLNTELMTQLSKRELKILDHIWENGKITSDQCTKIFKITRETANQDFRKLMQLKLISKQGTGRATHYILGEI